MKYLTTDRPTDGRLCIHRSNDAAREKCPQSSKLHCKKTVCGTETKKIVKHDERHQRVRRSDGRVGRAICLVQAEAGRQALGEEEEGAKMVDEEAEEEEQGVVVERVGEAEVVAEE
jgi:hypothetical protein